MPPKTNTTTPTPGKMGSAGQSEAEAAATNPGITADTTSGHSYLDGQGASPGQTVVSGVADTRPAPTFKQRQNCGPFSAPVGADEEQSVFHRPG